MKKLVLPIAIVAAIGFFSLTSTTANASNWRVSFGGHGLQVGYGGYGGCHSANFGGGYRWHDTTHYDYHPGHYWRHGSHLHFEPGHYDLHRGGHWDQYRW